MITVDWEEIARKAVDDSASNVHGVGVVKLSISPPEGEEMERLSREALAHGLHLAQSEGSQTLAGFLAHLMRQCDGYSAPSTPCGRIRGTIRHAGPRLSDQPKTII